MKPIGPFPSGRSTKIRGLILAASLIAISSAEAAEPPVLKPVSGVWPAGQGFAFDKKQNSTRRSVSGIACETNGAGQRTCLVVFDEGVEARFAVLDAGRLDPLPGGVALIPGRGELDAEGAALDGNVFYATGSHSAKRSTCDNNPESRYVVRFSRDPVTGGAARDSAGRLAGYAASGSLWTIMASLPELAPYVGEEKCLGAESPTDKPRLKGQFGVNVEGLAAKSGSLYFGFRGPSLNSRVPILEVDAAGLFDGTRPNAKVTMIQVGLRRGIRDLQAVKEGFLVLAGPDDDEASSAAGWTLSLWDGGSSDGVAYPAELARLDLRGLLRKDCDRTIKPEAITVLDETPASYHVLVLSDGMCDGGPVEFRIPR